MVRMSGESSTIRTRTVGSDSSSRDAGHGSAVTPIPFGRSGSRLTRLLIVITTLRGLSGTLRSDKGLNMDYSPPSGQFVRRVLLLKPTFMKLDRSWVHGLEDDPAKMALIAGLQSYASKTGCRIIAEGIETESELAMVCDLGVDLGQGYLLGRPEPLVPRTRPSGARTGRDARWRGRDDRGGSPDPDPHRGRRPW